MQDYKEGLSSLRSMLSRYSLQIIKITGAGSVAVSLFFLVCCMIVVKEVMDTKCLGEQRGLTAFASFPGRNSVPFEEYAMAQTIVENEYNMCVNTLGSTHSSATEMERVGQCHFMSPPQMKEIINGDPVVVTPRLVNLTILSVITLSAMAIAVVVVVVSEATKRSYLLINDENAALLEKSDSDVDSTDNKKTADRFLKLRGVVILLASLVVIAQLVGTVVAWKFISEIDIMMLGFGIIAFGMTILVILRFVPSTSAGVVQRIETIRNHAGDGCMETILLFSCIVQPLVYVAVIADEYNVTNISEVVCGALTIFALFAAMYIAESCYGKLASNPDYYKVSTVKSVTTSTALVFSSMVSFVLFVLCVWFLQATTRPFGLFDMSFSRWNNSMLLVNFLFPLLFIGRWALLPYAYPVLTGKKEYYTNISTLVAFVFFYVYYLYVVVVGCFYQKYDALLLTE